MKYQVNETKAMQLISNWQIHSRYLNQSEKASMLGLSTSVVNRLQNGNKKFEDLNTFQFLKFAAALKIHPMELMEESDEKE